MFHLQNMDSPAKGSHFISNAFDLKHFSTGNYICGWHDVVVLPLKEIKKKGQIAM